MTHCEIRKEYSTVAVHSINAMNWFPSPKVPPTTHCTTSSRAATFRACKTFLFLRYSVVITGAGPTSVKFCWFCRCGTLGSYKFLIIIAFGAYLAMQQGVFWFRFIDTFRPLMIPAAFHIKGCFEELISRERTHFTPGVFSTHYPTLVVLGDIRSIFCVFHFRERSRGTLRR